MGPAAAEGRSAAHRCAARLGRRAAAREEPTMSQQAAEAPARPARYQLESALGRLTPAERAARGKAARAAVPRASHAVFDPGPGRADPIALLAEQAQPRVPELVPVRWGRMMVSPFTFYRGAALPMASDLATTPVSRLAVRNFAAMTDLAVWYARADMAEFRAQFESQLQARQRKALDKGLAKARTRDSMQEVAKLTRMVDGRPQIISDPPLLVPVAELVPREQDLAAFREQLTGLLAGYRRTLETDRRFLLEQYQFTDMARKVVGVGSVGNRCWIVLMLGRDESDPLFLQVKEAERSVLSRFVGASRHNNQGQRVVAGQRLMQAASDIFLGWQRTEAGLDGKQRDFYVRQLRDWKFSVDIETMIPRGLRMYGELCGWTLARAHARSGDRIAIAAYLGGSDAFDRAITEFASAYADQNERDHQALVDAVAAGKITAERGL